MTSRTLLLIIFLFSGMALIVAFGSEHVLNLRPCQFCWYQRYIYMGIAAVAAMGLCVRRAGTLFIKASLGGLLLQVFAALYHVGIERGFLQELESCRRPMGLDGDLSQLREQMMATLPASCAEVDWSFFGLSMSTFNAIFAGMMVILIVMHLYFNRSRP